MQKECPVSGAFLDFSTQSRKGAINNFWTKERRGGSGEGLGGQAKLFVLGCVLFLAPTKDGFCHHIGGDDLCVRVFWPLVGALVLGVFSMGVLLPNVGPA